MEKNPIVYELEPVRNYFNTSISVLTEEDSNFKPKDEMLTVAQHVAHVRQTIDWFTDGAFSKKLFDMNFEGLMAEVMQANSLEEESEKFNKTMDRALKVWGSKSDKELQSLLPDNPIMGCAPRKACVNAIVEHTAHHRGSLAVYTRLLGKTPKMPYMTEESGC